MSLPASHSHLVLIPCYNPGIRIVDTIRAARAAWAPVWVVIDGSTDASTASLRALAAEDNQLRLIELPVNQGKGAAILAGLQAARSAGFSHVLTMDADGQHPAAHIADFMHASQQAPAAMILGTPQFDADAPALRVNGRKLSNVLAQLQTLGGGIDDSLFGFRVYPLAPLLAIMQRSRFMRGFDFDPEAAVRLSWQGVRAINKPVPVRYFSAADNGVSHFHYLRDNLLLIAMNTRLFAALLWRWPVLLARRFKSCRR